MDKSQKQKSANQTKLKQMRQANVLEALKDLGGSTASSLKNDLLKDSASEFMKQMFGMEPRPYKKTSGELTPGGSISMDKVRSGEQEKTEKAQKQLRFERHIHEEEKALTEKKGNDLKLELHAITGEISKIAQVTPKLTQELQIAAMQVPVNPGIYHLFRFRELLVYLQGFRKNAERASEWLALSNTRSQKKGFWGQYQKHGGKRLLSSEDYSQRSAG